MHSSRVRTARLLPVSATRGCLLPGGVCYQGGVCYPGGVSATRGVSGQGGMSASGPGGCIPACNGADTPLVDRQTPVKT